MGSEQFEGFVRITDVLDYFQEPELNEWIYKTGKSEANRIKKIAMNVGSNVDEYIKAFVQGQKLPKLKTKEAESCVVGFHKWYEDYGKPKLIVGTRIFDVENGITGEPDLIWDSTIIDVKCATEIRPKYWLQDGAYQLIRRSSGKVAILRLLKHLEDYEYKDKAVVNGVEYSTEELQQIFLGMLRAFKFFKEPMAQKEESSYELPPRKEIILPE